MNILRRASTTRLAIAGTLVVLTAVLASIALASRLGPHASEALAGGGDPSCRSPARAWPE